MPLQAMAGSHLDEDTVHSAALFLPTNLRALRGNCAQLWGKAKCFPILKHHVTHGAGWLCPLEMLDRPHLVLADYELCRWGEILTTSMCPAHGTQPVPGQDIARVCVIPETAAQWRCPGLGRQLSLHRHELRLSPSLPRMLCVLTQR